MSLQDWYYTLAITQMVIGILLMIFAGVILWQIYITIREAPKQISEKISDTVTSIIQRNKSELYSMAAMTAVPLVLGKFRNFFRRK
ncbi:hypothetical protein BH09PAT2_BH09PAT2_10150 [soil metagenome]